MEVDAFSGVSDGHRRVAVAVLAAGLFGAVFALQLVSGASDDGVLLFFAVPIALLGIEFGIPGGLSGAAAAICLLFAYAAIGHPDVGVVGYAGRVSGFVLIGGVVGTLAGRLSEATAAHPHAGTRFAAEAIRREGESLKAAILDAALDCVITMDARGRVLDFNRGAQETFGYEDREAIGKELAALIVPPELRQRHREALARRVRRGEGNILGRLVEMTGMRKNGATFPVELAVTQVPGTEPPIFAGYLRDMTERKRSEERTRAQSEEIAMLAEARGELLAQLLLAEERTRQRIAQVLHDDALQRLLAAHQDLVDAAPGREGVTRAHKAIEGTIDRLRDAVVALHPVTLQQGDLDTALSAIVRQHAARGGFRYTVRVEEDASGLEDDLVLSIARELVTNIAKHAGASRCSVTVTREGERVLLEVADDGRGIPQGRQEAALREGHIGLAAAIQRMKAIGGEMEVSSEAGKGTVIRGHFPIGEREPAERNR